MNDPFRGWRSRRSPSTALVRLGRGRSLLRFGSAKATIERSLEVLRDEGLLASRQGSRTVVVALPDTPAPREGAVEPSEEFHVLCGYLQESRSNMNRLSAKLEELDEHTKDL